MKGHEQDNSQIRNHNIKMMQLHLKQKTAFRKLLQSESQIDYKQPKIIKLVCQGVPSVFRSKVWPALIENIHGITPKFYEMLIIKADTYISADTEDVIPERAKIITHLNKIEHDIERTYPQLKIYRKDNDQGQTLFNLLSTWTVFREDVGYIQGMSQVAGLLLLELKEVQAFTLFCSIMTSDILFSYQNMEVQEIQIFQLNFERRLKRGDESLSNKLKELGIQTRSYLLGWVMTLFTRTMNLDMVLLVWDILFAYNLCSDILIEVGYFLLQALKNRLGKKIETEELISILKNFKLTDIEACNVICKVRQFHCFFFLLICYFDFNDIEILSINQLKQVFC